MVKGTAYQITHEVRAGMLHELGDIYRKMEENAAAVECLRLADQEWTLRRWCRTRDGVDDGLLAAGAVRHSSSAPTSIATGRDRSDRARVNPDPQEADRQIQATVDTSRRTLALIKEEGYAGTYVGRIKLGQMLFNQMMMTRETPPELVAEVHGLLRPGRDGAASAGDAEQQRMADMMLQRFENNS